MGKLNIDPEGKLPEDVRKMVEEKLANGIEGLEEDEESKKMKERIKKSTPKQKWNMGLLPGGYKRGVTRSAQKTEKGRAKNKMAKKSRKINR